MSAATALRDRAATAARNLPRHLRRTYSVLRLIALRADQARHILHAATAAANTFRRALQHLPK